MVNVDQYYVITLLLTYFLLPAAIGYNQAMRQNRQVILWTLLCLFLPVCVLVILCLPKKKSDDHKISSPYLS